MVNKNSTDIIKFKQLSILIAQDGFLFYLHHDRPEDSFGFTHLDVNGILNPKSLDHFKTHYSKIVQDYRFKTLKLAFANPYYSLVPSSYYDETAKADYLKYNVQLFEEDAITAEPITSIDAVQVYIPLMNYHNAIFDQVEDFEYEHFTHYLIDYCKSKTDSKQRVWVFARKTELDIIAFDGFKFKLCNSFQYETDYDLVYYILFAVEELKFDQKQMSLQIYHDQEETEWLDILNQYILNVTSDKKNLAAFIV